MNIKICTKCRKKLPATTKCFHRHKHGKFGLDSVCKKCKAKIWKQWRTKNYEKRKAYSKSKRLEYKQIVISHYGGCCAVCGERCLAFLCIDHIDGGGNKHRRIMNIHGGAIYLALIRDGFPPGYQVLCHNHNMKKGIAWKRMININTHEAIRNRKRSAKLKEEVISHYGGKCSCPGCPVTDIDMLSMDHIHNNGTEHRTKEDINCGTDTYRLLKKNNYPPGFQILCMNCNLGRFVNGGTCPHL